LKQREEKGGPRPRGISALERARLRWSAAITRRSSPCGAISALERARLRWSKNSHHGVRRHLRHISALERARLRWSKDPPPEPNELHTISALERARLRWSWPTLQRRSICRSISALERARLRWSKGAIAAAGVGYLSPRSKERGSVEAAPRGSWRRAQPYLRARKSAAPL